MGTWGIKLFSNDTSCDVRDTYIDLLKKQYSDEDAEHKTYEEYEELIGTDEEALFWFSLAHTQWKNGRLSSEVKEKALTWISLNGGAELFEENKKTYERWLKYLVELEEMLLSPMPSRKVYRKPKEFERNPWNVGDMYAYQFHTETAAKKGLLNKYIVFQKIGNNEQFDGERYSVIQVYDKVFEEVPMISSLENIRILPLTSPPGVNGRPKSLEEYVPSFKVSLRVPMIRRNKNCYPQKHLTFVGNKYVPEIEYTRTMLNDLDWEKDRMEEWLCDYYLDWQGIEY